MKITRRQLRKMIMTEIKNISEGNIGNENKFPKKEAIAHAKTIRSALRGLGTDEDAIADVFSSMENSVIRLTQVASYYRSMFGRTMASDILDEMSNDELYEYIEANFEDGVQHLRDLDTRVHRPRQ